MANNESGQHLRFLLLSKTSYDKRCTANTILCKDLFDVHKIIDKPEEKSVDFANHSLMISVMDTPGLQDSHDSTRARQAIEYTLKGDKEGFDAILLVFRYPTRLTPEENESIQWIVKLIGEEKLKQYGVVVICNGKSFKLPRHKQPRENFEDYIRTELKATDVGTFGHLLNMMPNRYIFLDNDTIVDEDSFNVKEIKTLLFELVSKQRKRTSFYSASVVVSTYFAIKDTWLRSRLFHAVKGVENTLRSFVVVDYVMGIVDHVMDSTSYYMHRSYCWFFGITDPEIHIDESLYDCLEDASEYFKCDYENALFTSGGQDQLASEVDELN